MCHRPSLPWGLRLGNNPTGHFVGRTHSCSQQKQLRKFTGKALGLRILSHLVLACEVVSHVNVDLKIQQSAK